MLTFKIRGSVREDETGAVLSGFWAKAYDKDLVFDDLLGAVSTDMHGDFEILAAPDDFREFFEKRPDLYLKVFAPDRETLVYTSEHAVRCRAGRLETFDIRIPRKDLGGTAPARTLHLVADDGTKREDFDPGEALSLALAGVRPSSIHEVAVLEGDRVLFTDRLMSNARGEIAPTVIWAQLGLDDPGSAARFTVAEARAKWKGKRLTVRVHDRKDELLRAEVRLASAFTRPLVLSTDREGRILNGFEAGKHDALVSLYNVPFEGHARVYLVPRQYDWHAGDRIRPVRLASGRLGHVDVDLKKSADGITARVARARELEPGAYDFIVRQVRYGYEDDEDLVLRPTDLVGGRRITGLVVRKEFWASKVIRGGCTNLLDIAGRSIGDAPYVAMTNVFQVGEDVWGALDPAALDPNHTGKMVSLYVVPHKTAAQWSADNSLQHLAVLGGNPAVQTFQTQSWCVNANRRLLWPAATQVGEYDVVADFGNNAPDAASFVSDAQYNMPLDIIDGYILPGFRVVPDPAVDVSFTNAGHFTYDQSTQGTITVQGDGELSGSVTVNMTASVYFPADVTGASSVSQVSPTDTSYPLVVLVHGNSSVSTSYLGYEYLLQHLARNGFICASIHMNANFGGVSRARILREHIARLRTMFGARVQNNIGIMGHSRGGEAVCIAARLNQQEGWGHGINAVISLAPTDQYTTETLGGAWAKPYLVIYGSMDGDLGYSGDTGFSLYDRANGAEKSFVFVYGATHDRFNTQWGDADFGFGQLGGTDFAKIITPDAHQNIAKGYMAAFFRQYLRAETQWGGMFRGEWVPVAAATTDTKAKFYAQYQHPTARTVDDFEGAHSSTSWQTSTIGDAVQDALPVDPVENQLASIDSHSPHDTAGLLVRWGSATDNLRFAVPNAQRDVRNYGALQFRVTQKVNSPANQVGVAQDLRISLTDAAAQTRAILVSKFGGIPAPDVRYFDYLTKSAMRTIRIPLSAFTILCLTLPEVDLANIVNVAFEFTEGATGEVEIDSVQFTA
jgi:hypothetical protein